MTTDKNPTPAAHVTGALTCQCANTITDPCIVCGKGKTLVTAEWLQKMAEKEGDLDCTTGLPERHAPAAQMTGEEAARRIAELDAVIIRMRSERLFVIGFNDGFKLALDRAAEIAIHHADILGADEGPARLIADDIRALATTEGSDNG